MGFRRFRLRKQSYSGLRWRRRGGIWFLAFAILFAVLFQVLWLLETKLQPTLIHIAQTQVKQIAEEAVTEAAREQVAMGEEMNDIMVVERNQDNTISFVQIDQQVQAKVYERTRTSIQDVIHRLENESVGITLGQALQSNVLAQYGPQIPVEMWPKGAPHIDLHPRMEAAGVNNVMVTLMMDIRIEMSVVVPFTTETVNVDTEIPLAQAVVVGEVPQFYYYNDMGGSIQKGTPSQGNTGRGAGNQGQTPSSQEHPPVPPILPPVQTD
ncbi:sporulation protein YunB [Desmospora activa]|uniref:Sporulation protein YunB n=1 Tax=Desmospora activa DSM 45169 TaxID=1121389 RepID=A0A2T4Z6Y9_9BACL|nr:sporulation protein YunB [Desmospora activa]PTM57657.1 sporulation protein YunB [Desmospora activa DSM 45169]